MECICTAVEAEQRRTLVVNSRGVIYYFVSNRGPVPHNKTFSSGRTLLWTNTYKEEGKVKNLDFFAERERGAEEKARDVNGIRQYSSCELTLVIH